MRWTPEMFGLYQVKQARQAENETNASIKPGRHRQNFGGGQDIRSHHSKGSISAYSGARSLLAGTPAQKSCARSRVGSEESRAAHAAVGHCSTSHSPTTGQNLRPLLRYISILSLCYSSGEGTAKPLLVEMSIPPTTWCGKMPPPPPEWLSTSYPRARRGRPRCRPPPTRAHHHPRSPPRRRRRRARARLRWT